MTAKTRTRKTPIIASPVPWSVPALSEYQEGAVSLWPYAAALVEKMLTTMCTGGDHFSQQDAYTELYRHMLAVDPDYQTATEDENQGFQMAAAEDAAFMIGLALGQRLGPVGVTR